MHDETNKVQREPALGADHDIFLDTVAARIAASAVAACYHADTADEEEPVDQQALGLTGPRIDYTSQLVPPIRPEPHQTAQQNSDAILQWQNNSAKALFTLVFDEPGIYPFKTNVIDVRNGRKFTTNAGATIKATVAVTPPVGAPDRLVLVADAGVLEGLVIDGNDLCDYAVYFITISFAVGIRALNANAAAIYSKRQCALDNCSAENSPIGLQLAFGSESQFRNLMLQNNGVGANFGGSAAVNGENGGRVDIFGCRAVSNATFGLEFENVKQANLHGISVEGSSGIRIYKSAGIFVFGLRVPSGAAVVFDGAGGCEVYGSSHGSGSVTHQGNDRACRAFLVSESASTPLDIPHKWPRPNQPDWQAYCRHDGWLSIDGSLPNVGHWRQGDVIWKYTPVSGQPMGYRCHTGGVYGTANQPQWSALPNY
jgi:hypothetical protein